MDTQRIINAITKVSSTMQDGDQVTAYTAEKFTAFVAGQVKNQCNSDEREARAAVPEWFGALNAAKRRNGPAVILDVFRGDNAREWFGLFDDLDRITLQDYSSPNNRAQRLALLELSEKGQEKLIFLLTLWRYDI